MSSVRTNTQKLIDIQNRFDKIKKCIDSCVTINQLDKIVPFAINIYYEANKIGLCADLYHLIWLKGKSIIYKSHLESINKN